MVASAIARIHENRTEISPLFFLHDMGCDYYTNLIFITVNSFFCAFMYNWQNISRISVNSIVIFGEKLYK